MNRSKARELAMKVIFQAGVQGKLSDEDVKLIASDEELGDQRDYVYDLSKYVFDNLKTIDAEIDECSDKWSIDRMVKTDLAVMRLAVGEMRHCGDIPVAVVINEAVSLAKAYGTEKSGRFVNGVLGKISRREQEQEQRVGGRL